MVLPLLGVLASVVLLAAAGLALVMGEMSELARHRLFALGVLSWILGVGWGVLVNAKPLAPSSQG